MPFYQLVRVRASLYSRCTLSEAQLLQENLTLKTTTLELQIFSICLYANDTNMQLASTDQYYNACKISLDGIRTRYVANVLAIKTAAEEQRAADDLLVGMSHSRIVDVQY